MKGNNLKNISRTLTGNNANWLLFALYYCGSLDKSVKEKEMDLYELHSVLGEKYLQEAELFHGKIRAKILRMAAFGKPAFTFSMLATIKLQFDIIIKNLLFPNFLKF